MSLGFILPTVAKLVSEKRSNGRVPQIGGVPVSAGGGTAGATAALSSTPPAPQISQPEPVDRRGIVGMHNWEAQYIPDPTKVYGPWGTPFIGEDGTTYDSFAADLERAKHFGKNPALAQYVPALIGAITANRDAQEQAKKLSERADNAQQVAMSMNANNVTPPDYATLGDILTDDHKHQIVANAMVSMMSGNRPEQVLQAVKTLMASKAQELNDKNSKAQGIYNKNVSQHNASIDSASSLAGRAGNDAQRAGDVARKASADFNTLIQNMSNNNLNWNKLDETHVTKFNKELTDADEDPEVKAAIYARVNNLDPESAKVVWAGELFKKARTEAIPDEMQLKKDQLAETARWHSSLSSKGWAEIAVKNAQLRINKQLADSLSGFRGSQIDMAQKNYQLQAYKAKIKQAKDEIKSKAMGAIANLEGLIRSEGTTYGQQRAKLNESLAKQQGEITALFYQGTYTPSGEAAIKRAQMAGKEGGPTVQELPGLYNEAFRDWQPKDDGLSAGFLESVSPEYGYLRRAGLASDNEIAGMSGGDVDVQQYQSSDPYSVQAAGPDKIIGLAGKYIGTKYSPKVNGNYVRTNSTMDCSQFVQRVFLGANKKIGSTTQEQYKQGTAVPPKDIMPGDVIYFALDPNKPVSHCAIFEGRGKDGSIKIIHSGVKSGVARIDMPQAWVDKIVTIRRF